MDWNKRNHEDINDMIRNRVKTDEEYLTACRNIGDFHDKHSDVSDSELVNLFFEVVK